jgi:hypothetical protein
MTTFHIGDHVSLKPIVGDGHEPGYCAANPDPPAEPRLSALPGNPEYCWHGACKVIRLFQDDGVLVENEHHSIRCAEPVDLMMKR